MNKKIQKKIVNVHLTNVTGTGAVQVVSSLLPELEKDTRILIRNIFLPDSGKLSEYKSNNNHTNIRIYKRYLPHQLSRLIEFIFGYLAFDRCGHLLILGDMPILSKVDQTILLHSPHYVSGNGNRFSKIKFFLIQKLFSIALKYAKHIIVQTEVMKDAYIKKYSCNIDNVIVMKQPVPNWLIGFPARTAPSNNVNKLTLFYPAALYPHKNHKILAKLSPDDQLGVAELILTIDPKNNPAKHIGYVNCVGITDSDKMLKYYNTVDAILFLSSAESYGLPLLEGMRVGIPIICPDLPYAKYICGSEAIYFDPNANDSYKKAILILNKRLSEGWWPNWSKQLSKFPSNWGDVSNKIVDIILSNHI